MNRILTASLLSLALLAPAFGQAQAPAKKAAPKAAPAAAAKAPIAPLDPRLKSPVAKLDLKDGDTVVFLGDSITHQCLYTQYIEDYFYTRFPGVKIRFHNAGVGGDRASDALARFDQDVAAYKPKYVTILLGMNDGTYKQWDKEVFSTYEKGMLTILDKIKEIGATAIVMGPTMYDRNALLIHPNAKKPFDGETSRYYNAVLAYYGTFMRDQALERGLAYVDMFAPLNNYTASIRITDPNFTMIPDAVHPDANGQMVMAMAVLEQMHNPGQVASTAAEFVNGQWKVTVTGNKVADVQGTPESLSFTATEPCIPWIVPADAAIGYRVSVAGHHMSQEPFRVQGLAPGKYEVKIDGQSIGVFPSSMLAVKIELQNFEKAPQYQQALAVALLNKEKNEKAMKPIRDLYRDLKIKRRAANAKPEDIQAFAESMKPKIAELEKLKAEYETKIAEAAQPKPHKYEIVKVSMN
jgi:lysophospholipase L1-like esterase